MSGNPARPYLPLCLLRIWCRKTDSWLSFTDRNGERFLVGAGGYFIELPSGGLAAISVRAAFPTIDRFPCLVCDDLEIKREFGSEARLISVPASGSRSGKPQAVQLGSLTQDLNAISPFDTLLTPVERYLALRLLESGLVAEPDLLKTIENRGGNETFGQALLRTGLCAWEPLLTVCMDVRQASRHDPPSMRTLAQRREWELTGEILIAMGKLNRTKLEEALQVKRDGSRAIGEILTLMGACSEEDIKRCLEVQRDTRHAIGSGVALIGQLLITRGVLSFDSLENAIRNQKIGRQSLEKILKSMGACSDRDIEDFVRANNWHSFQEEIDDIRLGHWLEKVGTISRQQLEEALRIQERGRQVLGELLVSLSLCSAGEIEQALRIQKEIREDYKTGIEKLGAILIKCRKVEPDKLEQALALQSTGRQRIGSVLVALKGCLEEDVSRALEIQRKWRERSALVRDRLGDVLRADVVITTEELDRALYRHVSLKLPLGRVLVEERICTPEQIVAALIARDDERQSAFRAFLRLEVVQAAARAAAEEARHAGVPAPVAVVSGRNGRSNEESFLRRLSSWIIKRK